MIPNPYKECPGLLLRAVQAPFTELGNLRQFDLTLSGWWGKLFPVVFWSRY